jgi:hypothetical protein
MESIHQPHRANSVMPGHRGQGESLVPPYTRGSVSLTLSDSGPHRRALAQLQVGGLDHQLREDWKRLEERQVVAVQLVLRVGPR